MRTLCGTILAAAIFSSAYAEERGTDFSPCDLDFKCVWRGRSVFDAEMPFPDGVSFVPSVAGLLIAGEVIRDLIKE